MRRPLSSPRRLLPLLMPLLVVGPAGAYLPTMVDATVPVAGADVVLRVPQDWQLTPTADGLATQRDPGCALFGAASLSFHRFDTAPSPDDFLQGELDRLAGRYTRFEVVERSAPEERPRVRLARVRFRELGFVCTGYVMAVVGRQTGTIGFAHAEAVTARDLRLDEFVGLLVAGSYEALPVRSIGGADPAAQQATDQAVERLYGEAADDLKQVLSELNDNGGLDPALLDRCAFFQPLLRTLKGYLTPFLTERERERIDQAPIYCVPSADFNAFALGRNDLGPGLLAFFAGMCDPIARAAEHYCSLREKGLDSEAISASLTEYYQRLATAVLMREPPPEPEPIDWADGDQVQRFVTVFNSMIGTVLAHEMAHYYMRHSESGQTGDPHSVQQREVAADAAAVRHLQRVADDTTDIWEGGIVHCFGFFTTIDNVLRTATGQPRMPEYMSTHPFGETRLNLASAMVGADNLRMRNDPWHGGEATETDDGGAVRVVGGTAGGPPPPAGAPGEFQHPGTGVVLPIPPGWNANFDPSSGLVNLTRAGLDGQLPLMAYTAGGMYPAPQAICDEILEGLRASQAQLEVVSSEPVTHNVPGLAAHLTIARGQLGAQQVTVAAVGAIKDGVSHGLMLLTPNPDRDLPDFQRLLGGLRFP